MVALREAGAHEQVTALVERVLALADLDHPHAAPELQDMLRAVEAHEQDTALVERLPSTGKFDLFILHREHQEQFRFGREPGGSAAPARTWNDME